MGPELTRIGDKVRRDWLFSFLKDPHREQPDTAMLQYRLDRRPAARSDGVPARGVPDRRAGAEPPPAAYQDARAVAAGRADVHPARLLRAAIELAGIHDTGKIGPSLAGVADRDPEQLPYGGTGVRHTTDNYIFLKVLKPDALGQPSLMPTFCFTPAQAATITLALASIRKADLPASLRGDAAAARAVPAGAAPSASWSRGTDA